MPGGDEIGSRPIDLHIQGLRRMGAEIGSEHGFLVAETRGLHGAAITLDYPSVGATENLMMAAVRARGTTVIDNAAREPEIADIAGFLGAMGAHRGGGHQHDRDRGRRRAHPGRPRGDPRPHRGRHVGGGRGRDPRRRDARARPARSPRPAPAEAERRGGRRRDDRAGAAHPSIRARERDRLRHTALPGRRDRLPADPHGDARDRRGHEHRDRERLREPVPLRGRASSHGGRHPDRGAPRGDPRGRSALGGPGAGARHPGGRRDGDRGARRRRHHGDLRAAPSRSRLRGVRREAAGARGRGSPGRRAGDPSAD